MNAPLKPAHSPFGGSVARRILNCPGSLGLGAKVPPHLRKSSAYADRGTALHAATALRLDENPPAIDDLVGRTFGNYTVTSDDVENAVRPVLAYVEPLLASPGARFYLEQRATFPTVPDAFGTADLSVRIGSTAHIVDYKFGGLPVLALYPDGDEDIINPQPLFYGAAMRHSFPEFFAGVENIVLTILQPQSIEPDAEMVLSVDVTHDHLDAFVVAFRSACEEALSEAPRLARGDWCRFCPAKPICPLHTAPLLDFAQFVMPAPPAPADKEVYLRALARGLDLVDATKDLRTVLHDQAKRALENGDQIPGFALSAGRAERHWRDDAAAIAALERLGLRRDDIIAEELRSVKQTELRAKARGLKVPQELIASRRSGVSLVRSENVRVPVRRRDELAQSFAAKLESFQQSGD